MFYSMLLKLLSTLDKADLFSCPLHTAVRTYSNFMEAFELSNGLIHLVIESFFDLENILIDFHKV